jgi:2-keto-3-deoxy-L-rhamnonate aldolase RhmA
MNVPNTEEAFNNRFKEQLRTKEVQIGLWSSLASNIVTEILSYAGFDWILIDTEHAPNDITTLVSQLQSMKGSDTTPLVRPVWNDPIAIKRLLDIGFHNFIVPFVQNAEEAQKAVSAVRYPPRGMRGVSIGARGSCYGYTENYWHKIDDHIGLVVQIETLEAVDNIEAIYEVDGVDGIFIGPSDLAASLGYLANSGHPEVQQKFAEIVKLCRRIDAPVGILAANELDARKYIDMGFHFVGVGSDTGLLKKASRELAQSFKNN